MVPSSVQGPGLRKHWFLLVALVAWLQTGLLGCILEPVAVRILSHEYGTFLNGTSVTIVGSADAAKGGYTSLTVNGAPVSYFDGTYWSVVVPVDPAAVFNPIEVVLTVGPTTVRDRIVLVVGDGTTTGFVPDGDPTLDGVQLRLENTGLDQIAPVVESLAGDALDISTIVTAQNPLATGSYLGIVNYTANAVEVDFAGYGLDVAATPSGLDTTITITDFYIELDLDLGWLGACTVEIMAATTDIGGLYDLEPLAADPTYVDVNLVSTPLVVLGGFSSQFVSGICDDPLIGDIVSLFFGESDIQALMQDGFEQNLADPDGTGPLDSPIAGAIEASLAAISIAGPIGDALGGVVDAPISTILEDANGLTISADAAITSGAIAVGAPDLPASYTVDEPVPVWPATTPIGDVPYGMAFGISTSALNQLLKTQIEGGLLQQDITEFEAIPGFFLPLQVGILTLFIPELASLGYPGSEPAIVRLAPKLAPVFTGLPGSQGELAQMLIGGLSVQMLIPSSGELFLELEVGIEVGVDLDLTPAGLTFTIGEVAPGSVAVAVTDNPLNTNEANIIDSMVSLFPSFAGALGSALDAFPLPAFLGLDLAPLEVSRLPGGTLGVFADLTLAPTTTLENVAIDDLSNGDFHSGGGCWIHEWRHRVSGKALGNRITANLKGMLGSDAGCTTNDNTRTASPGFRVVFDVVSVPGEQWTIDVDHSLLGAFSRISDGYNDGFGFQDGGGTMSFTTDVLGSYTFLAGGGGSGSFDFAPSVASNSDGIGGSSSDYAVEFSGTNGVTLVGTGDATIQLDFGFDLYNHSNSNTAFPTANGDEQAIRFGKNDTIDNNFTAGQYPGMGNRNIADDGHDVVIDLSVAPIP